MYTVGVSEEAAAGGPVQRTGRFVSGTLERQRRDGYERYHIDTAPHPYGVYPGTPIRRHMGQRGTGLYEFLGTA